jgi:hypothetical protein
MGNIKSKRVTKETRNIRKENQENEINNLKNQLKQFEKNQYNDAIKTIKNSDNEEDNMFIMQNMQAKASILKTAEEQINRGGEPFTKADLIAMICYMRPEYLQDTTTISKNTVSELNAFIRIIIYNPKTNENMFSTLDNIQPLLDNNRQQIGYNKNRLTIK